MMMIPKYKLIETEVAYSGSELRPHWNLEKSGIYGSSILAFIGPCDVQTGSLVDMEDRLANDFIRSKKMLHFIGEFYGITLETGVFVQRLFMNHAEKLLKSSGMARIERVGDDLMVGDAKLSVSIATVSLNSVLIHWGINIDPDGAPVKALGLNSLNWDRAQVFDFAKKCLDQFIEELQSIQIATVKVKSV